MALAEDLVLCARYVRSQIRLPAVICPCRGHLAALLA